MLSLPLVIAKTIDNYRWGFRLNHAAFTPVPFQGTSRLEKLLANLVKQITGKQQKLNNESFVSRAPEEVGKGERASLCDLSKQRESVEGDIKRLRSKAKAR